MQLRTGRHNVLVMSDLQIPFHHRDALPFLSAVADKYDCDTFVNIGDEVDQYALSKYTHDPDAQSAGDEQRQARKVLSELYELFPNTQVCLSNHTDRVIKRAVEAGIPKHYMKDIKDFMEAPRGWNWARSWEIDGVRYEHGDSVGGNTPHRLAAIGNRQSTVIGHHVTGGIEFVANEKELIFGMCVSCLVDMDTVAFAYSKAYKTKPVLSCGVVLKGIPHLIPMVLNNKGRWTGKL